MFIQQLLNGITLGGIYALISLGYTMVYGVLLMINFAHSEIFMLGSFAGLSVLFLLTPLMRANIILSLIIVFFAAIIASGIVGVIVEKFAYRSLRKSGRLAPLISAIGISIVIQNLVMIIVSPQSLPFPEIFPSREFGMAGLYINSFQIFVILTSLFLMGTLHYFIQKTTLGYAIRAVSSDKETAALMGINTNNIVSLVFFIGGGLGGAAGVLVGIFYGSIKYNMGFIYGIKAFTASVLGGIGNIPGAMIGGLILGILESLGAGYISSTYKDVFAFVILIIVLIVKPTGLLGNKTQEKC